MHGTFGWYELVTDDVEAAKAFYGKVVGWTAQAQGGGEMDYTVFSVADYGVAGLLALTPQMIAGGGRPGWLGYIVADDVDATVADLTRAGGALHKGPQDVPGMLRFAVVSDPQGAVFTVFTPNPNMQAPPPPAAGTPGTFGWRELVTDDWQAAWTFYAGLFGWKKAMAVDMGPMGTYQTFGLTEGDEAGEIGGMMDKPPGAPMPSFWAYYINVEAIGAAVERLTAAGGRVINGPHPVPGGSVIVQALDPQGAMFCLLSTKA